MKKADSKGGPNPSQLITNEIAELAWISTDRSLSNSDGRHGTFSRGQAEWHVVPPGDLYRCVEQA